MKHVLLSMLLLCMATLMFSVPVTTTQAIRVAENWMLESTGQNFSNSNIMPLAIDSRPSHIFVVSLYPQGYVLVAGDDAASPIIGHNTAHNWGEHEIPEQLLAMLQNWQEQMREIVSRNLQADLSTSILWRKYDVPQHSFVANRSFRNVSPLMTTIWGQGTYYNAQCPSGTPVGCVATAMAQIMRYWSFPITGNGSHSYNHPTYGTQTADFGATTYNWSAMPNNVTSPNAAVATISRHAGVAVNMQYAPDGSGAYSTDVPAAMINYFRYATSTQYRSKSSYTAAVWEAMMKSEIDNARPVYYSGSSAGSGGHAFVLDGYTSSNFHVNWGWNGYYNGYYTLTALNPGTDNFSSGQAAVVGILPTVTTLEISEGFEGTTFPPVGWTTNGSTTFTRSTTSPITGTASAYYTNSGSISGVRLITPQLAVNSSSAPITFKAKRGNTDRLERITVAYSSSVTGPWTNMTTFTPTATATTFTQVTTGLTPGNYFFALVPTSTNTNQAKAFWIDDFTGPAVATKASLNISSWNAGNLSPGDQARSDNIFTLSNTGSGTLTVTSVTNLSSTEFATNFNPNISLVYGQTHDFGFTYDPLNYGSDNVNFQIVTNAGTVSVALSGSATYAVFYDGFENYSDFLISFPPWTQHDGDGLSTWGVNGYSWPNVNYTGAWMIFNPSATTPSMSGTNPAYNGQKVAACWAANSATVANNDWLISPQLTLATAGTVSFWARSFSASYLENFSVKYSTTTNAITSFTNTLANVTNAPATWTSYSYNIPQTARYIAIQCTSLDKFALWVDEFKVADSSTPPAPTFGNLNGYVYEFGTTNPIGNALVTVGSKQAVTNSFGYYQINNILTGTISASCTAPGMFYHPSSATGIVINNGATTNQNFGLKWGEIAANPTSVSYSLYQGETGSASVTLSNPGGTAATQYAGYFTAAVRGQQDAAPFVRDRRKPAPTKHGVSINPITVAVEPDRYTGWFSYATLNDAGYFSGAQTERGNFFMLSDFAMMDGSITVSQLRGYFYNPSSAAWTTTTHRTFAWKIYSVSPTGTVTLLHTSANILLPAIAANAYTLNEYTLPSAVTIPAGHDFIVTAKPSASTDTSGRPQSLATDVTSDNGLLYDATNGWQFTGLNYLMDAYVNGTEWLASYNFSGSIAPGGSVVMPLNFNGINVSQGTKNAYMYVFNDANYTAPSPRGDALVVPISLNVTVATVPTAVLNLNNWTTNAMIGAPSNSGAIFQLRNVGQGNLTITSVSGLAGSPFTTTFNSSIVLAQHQAHDFSFTFNPTANGIYNATFTIVTNGGTKTITLKGYANYVAESFEGATFPPDGWVALDQDADTYNWMQYTAENTAHTGLYSAGSASWISTTRDTNRDGYRPALTPDNWLITPRLAISNGDELSWWIGAQDPAWPAEYYSVMISTTNSSPASFTNTLFSETLTNGDWLYRSLDLSAYAGQSVFIAFRHHNCTDQFVLKLDDVLMPPLAAPLVYGNITGRVRKAGTDQNLANVTVSVAGRNAITGEDGNYTLSNIVVDTYPITATATGYVNYSNNVTLLANQTLTHNIFLDYAEFSTPVTTINMSVETGASTSTVLNLSNIGTAAVNWTADSGVWGGDAFPAGAFYEDFEDLDISGWVGSVGDYSDIYTGYGYNSQRVWVFASNLTPVAQWIATTKIRVQTGDNLSFWYKQFNLSSETFEVRISTTDNAFASFTNTLATIGPLDTQDWIQFNQSLNAYAGQDIYVMFYYPRVDAYQYGYILIDNVGGGTAILPPAEWLSSTPAGTLNAGQSLPFTLYVDATGRNLPVGNYTAQTWVFGTATNSPYKLYVNLTVTEPMGVDAPLNLITVAYDTYMELAWDPVDGANSYHVYVSDSPYGTFQNILNTESNSAEFTWAQISAMGFPGGVNRAFFKVTADTAPARQRISTSKSSSPTLSKLYGTDRSRVLYRSE